LIANLYLFKYEQGPLEKSWRKLYSRSVDKKLRALEIQNTVGSGLVFCAKYKT
jgi:hypothetical protein